MWCIKTCSTESGPVSAEILGVEPEPKNTSILSRSREKLARLRNTAKKVPVLFRYMR